MNLRAKIELEYFSSGEKHSKQRFLKKARKNFYALGHGRFAATAHALEDKCFGALASRWRSSEAVKPEAGRTGWLKSAASFPGAIFAQTTR